MGISVKGSILFFFWKVKESPTDAINHIYFMYYYYSCEMCMSHTTRTNIKLMTTTTEKNLILLKSSDAIRFDFIACHLCYNVLESFIKRWKKEKFYLYTLCFVKSVRRAAGWLTVPWRPHCARSESLFWIITSNDSQVFKIANGSFQPRFLFIKSIDALMKQIIIWGLYLFLNTLLYKYTYSHILRWANGIQSSNAICCVFKWFIISSPQAFAII